MAEKKLKVNLKDREGVIQLFEMAVNEAKETPTSIALGNLRTGTAKGRIALEKLSIEYAKLKDKYGLAMKDTAQFFEQSKVIGIEHK